MIQLNIMQISDLNKIRTQEVFIDYSFEDVAVRTEPKKKECFVKKYGQKEQKVEFTNKLFKDVLLFGNEISKEQYTKL